MTENRRIFLNIIAIYGRSLYGLVLGLLCGRWALMVLGETDYGLNGLVGGLAAFVSFFNTVLAVANARFYAFSIGAAKVAEDKDAALEECRHWFNTALSIHAVVPFFLIAIGYPLGVYAINHWLTIPADRLDACVWVFRFVCISCFVGMVNVPFMAMYGAKQYIVELTIYSFVTSTINVLALWYMLNHPRMWLTTFAALTCFLSVVPQVVICVRACRIFPECKMNISYMWDVEHLRKIGSFSGWQMLGVFCAMLRTQGMSIVINKFFGAAMNAANAVGTTVQGHCSTLAGAMQSAFVPVITQACGAKDYDKMNKFVIRTCKFNVLLMMIFALPLGIELPEIMRLWLKNPPAFATGLCYCALIFHLADTCTMGHCVAVNALGKIAQYQVVINSVSVLTIPLAIMFAFMWGNVYIVMAAQFGIASLVSMIRLIYARNLCGTSVRAWLNDVFLPLLVSIGLASIFGIIPRCFMAPSFCRVCVTTLCCEIVFLPMTWFLIMNDEERKFIVEKIGSKLQRLFVR